jgi:hypothetical protein
MPALFAKLNHKGQSPIVVLDAPASFDAALAALDGVEVRRAVGARDRVTFGMAFATTQAQLDASIAALVAAAEGDAILWFCYPKGTSKRYRCDFNRDTGWGALGAAGWEGVRQVAIDEDWSALRFRRVEHVKAMTRAESRAGSAAGKARVAAARTTTPRGTTR